MLKSEKENGEQTNTRGYNSEQRPDSTGLREQSAGEAQGSSDGVDIRVLTSGIPVEQSGDNENRPRYQ